MFPGNLQGILHILGGAGVGGIDTISGKLQEQDLVLMTTDGIHYALRPDAMSEIILNSPPEGTEATNALVNAAKNIVKYPDNMSAMLIYMPSGFL